MRQAGRYLPEYRQTRAQARNFLDFCLTPELAIEATLQPIRRYGFDAAILFSDIMSVPYALGQKVWFEEGRGPRLDPVRNVGDLEHLSEGRVDELATPIYQAVTGIRRSLPPETALIGFAGAPWTVASYMVEGGSSRDYEAVKGWAYGDPEGFRTLIDLLVRATTRYLSSQVEAGAEALQLFDSWAGALPAWAMREWCLEPVAAIIRGVREKHPDVPIIVFPRGAGPLYADYAESSGAQALALDTTISLPWARATLQPKVAVQGNLDPVLLTVGGESLTSATRRILETLADGPFVFNLGTGILPSAKPELVETLVEQVRSWRR